MHSSSRTIATSNEIASVSRFHDGSTVLKLLCIRSSACHQMRSWRGGEVMDFAVVSDPIVNMIGTVFIRRSDGIFYCADPHCLLQF